MRVWLTVSKAPLISSCSSDATAPCCHAVCTASVTTRIASSVDLAGRFPIWPLGSRLCSSAALAMRLLIAVSITFPMALRSAIGRYAPGVRWALADLPGFRSTTTLAQRKRFGKYSHARLAFAILAIALANGCPHIFRNPVGRLSLPGAFQAPVLLMICVISARSTLWLTSNRCLLVASAKVVSVMSERSAGRVGKNRSANRLAFSSWVCAEAGVSSDRPSGGIAASAGLRELRSLAHLLMFHSVFGSLVALAMSSRHRFCLACAAVRCRFLYARLLSSQFSCDGFLRYARWASLALVDAACTSSVHHLAALPPWGLRFGTAASAILCSSRISISVASSIACGEWSPLGIVSCSAVFRIVIRSAFVQLHPSGCCRGRIVIAVSAMLISCARWSDPARSGLSIYCAWSVSDTHARSIVESLCRVRTLLCTEWRDEFEAAALRKLYEDVGFSGCPTEPIPYRVV